MTIGGAIATADQLKPNAYTNAEKTRWLYELDGTILEELIHKIVGREGEEIPLYEYDRDAARVLLAVECHADLYIKYLFSQIDFHNAEWARYNNSAAMFEASYRAFGGYLRRGFPVSRGGTVSI